VGFLLVVALLLWRLIESRMRRHLAKTQTKLPGWDDKPTSRPTGFMLTTKFDGIFVLKVGDQRLLGRPLSALQHAFLNALGLNASIFTHPRSSRAPP
jgi:hypothetical protein